MFKRKFLSFLISLMLVFSFPVSALADELYTPDGWAKQIDTYKVLPLSGSNAFRTLDASEDIVVQSSIGSVHNTIDWAGSYIRIGYRYGSPNYDWQWSDYVYPSIAGTFSYVVPSGKTVNRIELSLSPIASLPSNGKYSFSFDFASDSSLSYSQVALWMQWQSKNQESLSTNSALTFKQSSGDLYASNVVDLQSNVNMFAVLISLKDVVNAGGAIGGKFSINFTKSSSSADITSPGTAPSSDDIQSTISSTTSQIASSVNDVYDSIHDLMQHISNQLAALWDQMYNFMHVPMYNKANEILNAIKAIQLKVNIDISAIVDSINDMSTNVVDKVKDQISNDNKNADDIQNGYDNSGMNSDADKLDNSLKDYEDAEGTVLDSVNDALNDFSFDASLSDYKSIVSTVSEFIQALYDSSGGFKIVINLSLLLSIASLVIGFYRFKEGG